MLKSEGDCVTDENFLKNNILCEESLGFSRMMMASMIKNQSERDRYINKIFTNGLKRNLCYRNFLIFINKGCPLGRHNRVAIPRCVVVMIRQAFPEERGLYTLSMYRTR